MMGDMYRRRWQQQPQTWRDAQYAFYEITVSSAYKFMPENMYNFLLPFFFLLKNQSRVASSFSALRTDKIRIKIIWIIFIISVYFNVKGKTAQQRRRPQLTHSAKNNKQKA